MTRPVIKIYIDYKSPYAYLALRPALAFEIEYDVTLDWLPYNLPIADYLGAVDSRNEHQWRRVKYSYMDARRIANQHGLTVLGPQKLYDSTLSSIALLYVKKFGIDATRRFNALVFEQFFKRALNIEDNADVTAALAASGADAEGFEAYRRSEGAAEFSATVEEAHELGIFGVPSYVLDREIFWGSERLDLLKERLRNPQSA
jgi:2-hydroxychromene-2-carboxylate isomerase